MLPALLISALLTAQSPHPSKVQALLTCMNASTNSHEAVPSAPQTEPQVKAWMPSLSQEEIDKFHVRVDRSGGVDACWPWTGPRKRSGYGRFYSSVEQKRLRANRVAYALKSGPIPDDLCVMHECDNPPCCNPAHLQLGTRSENTKDMYRKGRENHAHGESHCLTKLNTQKVLEIRRRYSVDGVTVVKLAKDYGVDHRSIRQVIERVSWKHVT